MNGALFIISYILIPFIVYGINDYFAGLWRDRLNVNMSLYWQDEMPIILLAHLLWPAALIVLIAIWTYNLTAYQLNKFDGIWKFDKDRMYNAGVKKHQQNIDLDYQAEKALLGEK